MRTPVRTQARRAATALTTATLLTLIAPVSAAFAAGENTTRTGTAGGTALSISSGILLAVLVGIWAHRRRTVGIALVAFVAGVMLAGSAIALTAAQAGDQVVTAGVQAVSGIFA
ncbi:hypothetical protein ACIBSV_23495 [Embleya sp. NPDC050154]|uniref:hypothetical protein n=1 Tax=Embleya sp. NPDC050154 TaxID=3363988 RepID=UPI003799D226